MSGKIGRLGGTFSKGTVAVEFAIENPYRQDSGQSFLPRSSARSFVVPVHVAH